MFWTQEESVYSRLRPFVTFLDWDVIFSMCCCAHNEKNTKALNENFSFTLLISITVYCVTTRTATLILEQLYLFMR
jgi:hypothetical protein